MSAAQLLISMLISSLTDERIKIINQEEGILVATSEYNGYHFEHEIHILDVTSDFTLRIVRTKHIVGDKIFEYDYTNIPNSDFIVNNSHDLFDGISRCTKSLVRRIQSDVSRWKADPNRVGHYINDGNWISYSLCFLPIVRQDQLSGTFLFIENSLYCFNFNQLEKLPVELADDGGYYYSEMKVNQDNIEDHVLELMRRITYWYEDGQFEYKILGHIPNNQMVIEFTVIHEKGTFKEKGLIQFFENTDIFIQLENAISAIDETFNNLIWRNGLDDWF